MEHPHHREAAEMRSRGMLWKEIAAHFGVDTDTAHRWADPTYRRRHNEGSSNHKSFQHMHAAETRWANQYRSIELPTLAYVPFIELTENSKYRMAET